MSNTSNEINDRLGKKLTNIALFIIIIGFIIFIVSFILFSYKQLFDFNQKINSELFSHLGGFSGGIVGAIWGLSGVVLFYVALRTQSFQLELQKDEISMQREELKLTRIEVKRSADAQEKSEKALSEQSQILRKTLIYQAFDALTAEYRTPEMLQAVRNLWDFYRENKENLESVYLSKIKVENEKVNNAPPELRVSLEAQTIHNQRRFVSQFYSRIATFIDKEIIPEDIFYSSWGETDLEIIPKILIPLENSIIHTIAKGRVAELDDKSPLMQLYLKSKGRSNIL